MSNSLADDSQTLATLKADGDEAFAQLFARVRDQLKRMIERRLDFRLSARVDASDIVQEVYLRASHGLTGYLASPNVHPVVWLRLITKHMVAETHRRHFRAKRSPFQETTVDLGDGNLLANSMAAAVLSGNSSLGRREMMEQVRRRLAEMPQHEREVLEMRHIDSMSMHEIANSLDISTEAAKKRCYRAIARFRSLAADLISPDSK